MTDICHDIAVCYLSASHQILTFRGNHLDPFRLGLALANVSSLDYLSLQANALSIVNESTLPWEVRLNLKKLDLSRNPFLCSCDLLWFRTYVTAHDLSPRGICLGNRGVCILPVRLVVVTNTVDC